MRVIQVKIGLLYPRNTRNPSQQKIRKTHLLRSNNLTELRKGKESGEHQPRTKIVAEDAE